MRSKVDWDLELGPCRAALCPAARCLQSLVVAFSMFLAVSKQCHDSFCQPRSGCQGLSLNSVENFLLVERSQRPSACCVPDCCFQSWLATSSEFMQKPRAVTIACMESQMIRFRDSTEKQQPGMQDIVLTTCCDIPFRAGVQCAHSVSPSELLPLGTCCDLLHFAEAPVASCIPHLVPLPCQETHHVCEEPKIDHHGNLGRSFPKRTWCRFWNYRVPKQEICSPSVQPYTHLVTNGAHGTDSLQSRESESESKSSRSEPFSGGDSASKLQPCRGSSSERQAAAEQPRRSFGRGCEEYLMPKWTICSLPESIVSVESWHLCLLIHAAGQC